MNIENSFCVFFFSGFGFHLGYCLFVLFSGPLAWSLLSPSGLRKF